MLFDTSKVTDAEDAYGDVITLATEVKEYTETRTETKRPPMFKVVLLNDDYTPMDFVVEVLTQIFRKNQDEAIRIMLEVHNHGAGLCGVYTRDVAETKAEQTVTFARQQEHPLQCIVEAA